MDRAHAFAKMTALLKQNRFLEARDTIERSLLETPNDPRLLRRLAWACNHLGDSDAAMEALDRIGGSSGASDAPKTVPGGVPYDFNAVTPAEYAELVGSGRPASEGVDSSLEEVWRDQPGNGATAAAPTLASEAYLELVEDDQVDETVVFVGDDRLPPEFEDSPNDILDEAFADVAGSPGSFKIFDERSSGLEDSGVIEVQEARQSTRLTGTARVTRRLRARQQAAELLRSFGYADSDDIDAVAEIFFRFGWSSCRRALNGQLDGGATPRDLAVAHRVRLAWASNPLFNASAVFANETWRAPASPFPSWGLAVAIAIAFSGVPSDVEIGALLEHEFDRFLVCEGLHRDFGSFAGYLCDCRFDQTGRYLPSTMCTDFHCDWSLSDTDPFDRWESYVPVPNVGSFGVLGAVADRLAFSDSLFSYLNA